jgi:hypothetical protein
MNKLCMFFVYAVITVIMVGCGATTIKPNYALTNTDHMRIGGETPDNKEPEIVNLGAYCLKITDKWKADGKTPDGQTIWTKDSFRKAVPCQ